MRVATVVDLTPAGSTVGRVVLEGTTTPLPVWRWPAAPAGVGGTVACEVVDGRVVVAAVLQTAPNAARSARDFYTGDGTTSRTIALPFTPGSVVVSNRSNGNTHYSGVGDQTNTRGVISSGTALLASSDEGRPRCVTNGFVVGVATISTNVSGVVYDYMAVG